MLKNYYKVKSIKIIVLFSLYISQKISDDRERIVKEELRERNIEKLFLVMIPLLEIVSNAMK